MDVIKLLCRVRCFGLPLYSAIAREALAKGWGFCSWEVGRFAMSAIGGKADMPFALQMSAFDPKRTSDPLTNLF